MALIGFLGSKESGKTTAAKYLIQKGFVERAFADPIKRACQEIFCLTEEQVYGTAEQKETPDPRWFNCTPRKILQFVGTDLLRENLDKIMPGLGKNVFCQSLGIWYQRERAKNPGIRVVVSDLRFEEEVNFILSLGGVVVKLERDAAPSSDSHASEIELKAITNYDCVITNNGTFEEFYQKLDTCLLKFFPGGMAK